MFNNYIAKKRNRELARKLEEIKGELEWADKYRQKVQPDLLANYQQRIKSFMHQVEETPIIIQEPSKTIDPAAHCRFTFKNTEDWKSLRTVAERLNILRSSSLKKQEARPQCKLEQRRASLFEFSPAKTEYRTRDKLKQLHKPMKFPTAMSRKDSSRKKYRSLQAIKEREKQEVAVVNYENESSFKDKTNKQSDNISDFFEYRGRLEQVQFSVQEQQRKWDSKQKKQHFKKLMTMYLTGQPKQKQQLKQILDRCGYIKKKGRASAQAAEVDVFARIVQKHK